MRDGFEALVDGVLLLVVLLAATGVVQSLARPPAEPPMATTYADDVRATLFRATMDGLRYRDGDAYVPLRNATTVEAFLRLQVHLLTRANADFAEANERIAALTAKLVRPGWSATVLGGPAGDEDVIRIPAGDVPPDHMRSSWTYPPLQGAGPDVTLAVAVWLSPRR